MKRNAWMMFVLLALLLSLTGCSAGGSKPTEAQAKIIAEADRMEMIPVKLTQSDKTYELVYDADGQITGYICRHKNVTRNYVLDRKTNPDGTAAITVLRAPTEDAADYQETLPIIYLDEHGRPSKMHEWMTLLDPGKQSKSHYSYTYDAEGRLKEKTYTGGGSVSSTQYQWDEQGRLVQYTHNGQTYLVERNAYGEPIRLKNEAGDTVGTPFIRQYQNDDYGRLHMKWTIEERTYSQKNAVTYLYDAQGNLCGVQESSIQDYYNVRLYNDRVYRFCHIIEILGASQITWMTPEAYHAQAKE